LTEKNQVLEKLGHKQDWLYRAGDVKKAVFTSPDGGLDTLTLTELRAITI